MADLKNPIDADQLESLKNSKQQMLDAIEAIDRAKRAGIDMGSAREEAQNNLNRINQILQVYFPNQ